MSASSVETAERSGWTKVSAVIISPGGSATTSTWTTMSGLSVVE